MKNEKVGIESPGKTFLKSTSHVRVRETKGNYARSIAVGIQFGIIYLPGELLEIVIVPLILDLLTIFYESIHKLIFILTASVSAIYEGFTGKLEAVDEPIENDSYYDND